MSLLLFSLAMLSSAGTDASGVTVVRGNELSHSASSISEPRLNPRALDLVDSNPAIHDWAIRKFDRNGDGWLSLYEAQPVVAAFQEIADEDRDGAITVREYRAAIDYLTARY